MTVNWESLVIAGLAFIILYWLLNRYAFGPLFSIMEKRQELIQKQMSDAEQNRSESEKLLAEQKAAIDQSKKEAYEIIERARISSTKEADNLIAQAKEDAERIKNDALKDIESEKNKAIAALRSQVSALSVLIASKIIEKQVDEKSQQELIDHYLKEVGGQRMSKETVVAKRYARALFEVAKERGKIADVEQELKAIARALDENSDYMLLLEHPNIDASKKASMLKQVFEANVSEEVMSTLLLLVQKGREAIIRELSSQYSVIADDALGQAQAKVYTPKPLSTEESQKIAAAFGSKIGKTIRIENIVEPGLLGGLQVRIGDRLYDGSLSGKLKRIQQTLVEA